MWPSQRLASINLESWQGKAQVRRRDRRGIRPSVTLLEERTLLSQLPGTWAAVAPLPDTPDGGYDHVAVATSTNGLIYALGGGANTNEMEEYNPTTNAWSVVASSPQHSGSAATALNGLIYAISGAPSGEVDTYNPATNVWTVVAPQPGIHRGGAAVAGIDGRIYVLGGIAWNGGTDVNGNPTGNPSNEVDTYNPTTNSWTVLANLPTARNAPAAAVGLDGRIYAIGGYSALPLTATTEVDVYTPSTNSWAVLPSLPTARGSLAATTGPDGHIYAIGGRFGYGDNFYSSEVDAYSPTTNSWAILSSLPATRESLGATTGTDGRIYAVGGNLNTSNGRTRDVDVYVPVPPYEHKVTPIASWSNPSNLVYGTALGPIQLDATASVPGTFTYSPPAGTVLHAGVNSNLSATFTPTDTTDYNGVSLSATINVLKASPIVSWSNPANIVYGIALGTNQLDATASVPGTFTYAPIAGTVLNAGVGQTLSATFTPTDTTDYSSVIGITRVINVAPAPLIITANNTTKAYGAGMPALSATYSGFVNGDTVANLTMPPTLVTTGTASSHVLNGGYSITASGANDPNYAITYQPGKLLVTPAPLIITANSAAKVYGAALPILSASYSGLVNGDTSASLASPPTVSTTASSASHVGSYAINASGASDSDYAISYVGGTLIVTPAPLTITADSKTKVYGSGMPALTASYSGWVNGDQPGSLMTQAALSTTAIASSHVGSYAISATGAASSDYIISYVGGTLIVTPAPLTITANDVTKTYGAVMPTLTASYSGLVNGDTVASLGQGTNLLINGDFSLGNTGFTSQLDYIPISGSNNAGSDYDVVHNPSVDIWSAFENFGDHTTGTGLMFAANASSTPNTVAWDEMVNVSKAEDYVFSGWAASMGQYPIGNPVDPSPARLGVFVNGIQVGSAFQIPAQNGQWGQFEVPWYSGTSDFATIRIVDLNTDGIGNDFTLDDLVFSAPSSPGGASLATTATASSHVGSYAITASGAASSDYTISYVGGTLTVTPAPLTITANNASKMYGAVIPTLTVHYDGFVNGDTTGSLTTPPVLTTTATASSNVLSGGYDIAVSGATDSDYSFSYVDGTLTVTPAPLTVNATGDSMTYGGTVPALTYTYTGLVNNDTSATFSGSLVTTATSSSNVGDYPITQGTLAATGNYTISTYNPGTLTVEAAPLTISAVYSTKTYDGITTVTDGATPTVTGLVGTDSVTGLSESFVSPNAGSETTQVNSGYVVNDGNDGNNYVVTTVNGLDYIAQAPLTISAVYSTKTYDGITTVTDGATPTVSGLQGSDTVTGLSESFTSPNVLGTNGSTLAVNSGYVVDDANGGSNYVITTVNTATGTITPATPSFSDLSASQTITYGGGSTGDITVSGLMSVTGSNPLVTLGNCQKIT